MTKQLLTLLVILTAQVFPQKSTFENYLSKFHTIDLPFYFSYDLKAADGKAVPLTDHEVLAHLLHADSIPDYLPFRFLAHGKFLISQDRIVVVYIIRGGAGGIEMYFEMALYDINSEKLIDRMQLSAIMGDLSFTLYSEGVIDSTFQIEQKRLVYSHNDVTHERNLVSESNNKYKITNSGFVVLDGIESPPLKIFE